VLGTNIADGPAAAALVFARRCNSGRGSFWRLGRSAEVVLAQIRSSPGYSSMPVEESPDLIGG
jgi:hypothetical protein